jgi:hypothetical protein
MVLLVPKINTKSKYNLRWKLGPLELNGKGDGFALIGELKSVNVLRLSKIEKIA